MVKKNLFFNFLGRAWSACMTLIFLPYYIKILGIEAYGIVGFYITLQSLFSLLDLGLSTTVNREMAGIIPHKDYAEESQNLIRTLEYIYWPIAFLIGGTVCLLAPFFATKWICAQELSSIDIRQTFYCIGIALTFQWPFALYSGALLGLQKQVQLNKIIILSSTIRGLGMIFVLTFISPTIQAFFIWQIFVNILQTLLSAILLWKNLPQSFKPPRFTLVLLNRIKGFSIGVTGISILAIILTQLDKIILSKMLTLEMFGYYSFAAVISNSLYHLISPVFTTFFPRFSQLVSLNDKEELKRIYHGACQIMSVIIIPIAMVVIFFSREIILLWTHNPQTVEKTNIIASLLMLGTLFNGLMHLPYALQLAYEWTKLAFYQNVVGIIILVPLLLWGTYYYGAIGAACIWIILNIGYIFISIQFMHKKIIPREKMRWYVQDIGIPIFLSLFIAGIGRWYFPVGKENILITIFFLLTIFCLSILVCLLTSPFLRNGIIRALSKQRLFVSKKES